MKKKHSRFLLTAPRTLQSDNLQGHYAHPTMSQEVWAPNRIDRDVPVYGGECRVNGMSIREIAKRSLD